ncbi:MAG: phosphoserine phosphatase SerB [Bacteroidales bacterium]
MENLYNLFTLPKGEISPQRTQVHFCRKEMELLLHKYLHISKTSGTIISCSKTSGSTSCSNHFISPCNISQSLVSPTQQSSVSLSLRSLATPPLQSLATLSLQSLATLSFQSSPAPQLICFDMDSTLIKIEIIDELADYMGIGAQMRKITAETMYGKLNFRESFLQRVMLLKGLDITILDNLAETMPVAEGLQELINKLKSRNIKTAIITGNFSCFGKFLQKKYGFNHIFTTEVETIQTETSRKLILSGNIKGEIIDAPCKSGILLELCKQENITPAQCIAVGDGANDLPMLMTAGTGIIYNAKSCGDITKILQVIP